MRASVVDFRKNSKAIFEAIQRNEEVTVLYRGKVAAVMKPVAQNQQCIKTHNHSAFGMWEDREDLGDPADQVRELRKGRFGDL
ncbi:MAG: hypothetical protein ACLFVU_05710 [Phycisphaerae bacterium]